MAFTKKYSITIDKTKCGTADTTDFPMLFAGTYAGGANTPDLRTTANGGNVTSANGYDICFYSDEACTTMLKFERVQWSATTGLCEFHVKIPTLTYATNTVIYLGVGDSGITTDQQDADGTWAAGYLGVYHMEGASTDTSGNSRNGTDSSGITYTTTNQVATYLGKSWYSAGDVGGKRTYLSTTGLPTGASSVSTVCWARWGSTASGWQSPLALGANSVAGRFMPFSNTTTFYIGYANGTDSHASWVNTNWKRLVLTYDGTTGRIYVGGSELDTQTGTQNISYGVANIGATVANEQFNGNVDEAYIYSGALTSSWVKADYNNQSSPSTFYTITEIASKNIIGPFPTHFRI